MEIANFVPRGYEIIRFLGSGGTASVYLARRKADGRMFALKAPLLTDSPLSLSVFRALVRREYQLINKANYPGLVRIYDLDETDNSHPFLVMEYCPGKSLDQFDRILSPDILLNILSSISINLFFVHISGIYHGDLKPHNIFLTGDPESYGGPNHIYSKLSDFSLALKVDELLPARLGMGTVGYMAPETIERNSLDFRSDIFALGVIGYKLATGQHPFWPEGEKTDPVRISAAITEFQPSPPEQIRSSLPAGLSELIMQMLAKDPQKRPENAYAICEQLERAGASYPFRKMISPKHLISVAKTSVNSDFLKAPFWDISGNQIKAMLDLVGDDTSYLRHVVQINFVSGKIVWQGGKLRVVENDLIWPNNIKRRLGEIFGKLPLHLKKKAIQAAIIGEFEEPGPEQSGNLSLPAPQLIRPLLKLIHQGLSPSSRRRLSNRLAQGLAEDRSRVRLAARLFLQAENITEGFGIILDAINEEISNHQMAEALKLLDRIEKLCRQKDNIEKLKIVLMKRGDSEKMTGDTVSAEKTYTSLIALYKTIPVDRLLAETYKDLGDLYKMKQDYHSGIKALRQAEQIYLDLDDQLELSHTINNIGNIYSISNDLTNAYAAFRRALHLQRRLKATTDAASTLNNIAVIFYMRGRFERATNLFKLSLKLTIEAGNAAEIARGNNNLGFLYLELGQFGKAKGHLRESFDINRKINNRKEQLFNLNNLAQVNILLGSLKEALSYLKEGKNLADKLSDLPHRAEFIATTAIVQRRMGLYGSALESIKTALALVQNLADRRDAALWYIYEAEIYQDLKDHEKAGESLTEAEKLIIPEDKKALFKYNLVKGVIYRNRDGLKTADRLALELNSPRDRWVTALREALILLDSGDMEKGHKVIMRLNSIYIPSEEEIETSRFHLVMGIDKYARGEIKGAQYDFTKGLECSLGKGLLPEVIESTVYLGKISADLSEFEAGYENYRKALNGYKNIADDIKDEGLRKRFLSDEKIAILASEIRKMNQILA